MPRPVAVLGANSGTVVDANVATAAGGGVIVGFDRVGASKADAVLLLTQITPIPFFFFEGRIARRIDLDHLRH